MGGNCLEKIAVCLQNGTPDLKGLTVGGYMGFRSIVDAEYNVSSRRNILRKHDVRTATAVCGKSKRTGYSTRLVTVEKYSPNHAVSRYDTCTRTYYSVQNISTHEAVERQAGPPSLSHGCIETGLFRSRSLCHTR